MRFYFYLLFLSFGLKAQVIEINPVAQDRALNMVLEAEKAVPSSVWPNIDRSFFFKNLKENIEHPLYIYQGKPTYFCSYAAITHYFVLTAPEDYAGLMLELYKTGSASVYDRKLSSSKEILEAAGALENKGEMDINHADQLWFLVLADNYKGYLNLFKKTYKNEGEDNFWASTNLKKFNQIIRSLTGKEVDSRGADLAGPLFLNYYKFIKKEMQGNTVFLYLNNKALYPSKFFRITPPTPTHYVMLYEIKKDKKYITMDYWDYGLRSVIKIRKRKFRKLTYGITSIKK